MKTLYISDLDGTLLNKNTKLSQYTIEILNHIIQKGYYFSYATARSFPVAHTLTNKLDINIPIVAHNGVFIIDPKKKKNIISNFFTAPENRYLIDKFKETNILPNVYSFIDKNERVSLIPDYNNPAKKYYLDTRKGDKRLRFVNNTNQLYVGDTFYYLCIGYKEKLQPLYDILSLDDRFNVILAREHNNDFWLDIMPKNATKANAILKLKNLLKCDKIISFGDGLNDIPMFQISDECYAMENAVPELKKLATDIIPSNNNDGVAKWLYQNLLQN